MGNGHFNSIRYRNFFSGKSVDIKAQNVMYFLVLLVGIAIVIWFVFPFQRTFFDAEVLFDYAEAQGGVVQLDLSQLFLAIMRFLMGPGPVRGIFGWEVFQVTTTIGNILVTLGAIVWWFYLPVVILALFSSPTYWIKYFSFTVSIFLFLLVYSVAYSGSLETRFRAVLYVLSFAFSAPFLHKSEKKKDTLFIYLGMSFFIWIFGLISSYQTMVKLVK